jgi:hypothetical protein
MPQPSKVYTARRPAPRAPDLKPPVATVDRLIDRRRRVDRSAVRPQAFVPALAEKVVRFPDQRLAGTARLVCARRQNDRHRSRLR